jgi:hypothetical protein
MTSPFASYAFPATGAAAARTMPDRLADIKNVRDFGAVGDGVTDDWAAIMAAFNWTTNTQRGTIYFPPGNYYVSQRIDFTGPAPYEACSHWRGELGLSTITGNFADYILYRGANDTGSSEGGHLIENLTIINNNASGGGIRFGESICAAIRNCTITANKGINTCNIDSLVGGSYCGSLEFTIENCVLSPGSNVSNSQGILSCSNGPIVNCRIVGFSNGLQLFGGEGAMSVQGCYFEQNGTAIYSGLAPDGTINSAATGAVLISGCRFKNNSVAIRGDMGVSLLEGLHIEGANGAAPGGRNPQYGILMGAGLIGQTLFRGIIVTGQYDVAGIYLTGGEVVPAPYNTFMGVQVTNTGSGVPWHLPSTAFTAEFIACNVAPVYTISQLPAPPLSITNATWSGGTATISASFGGFLSATSWNIVVSGVNPSGYNGTYTAATPIRFDRLSFPAASNPGSYVSGGTVVANPVYVDGTPDALEGDCYNVRDASTASWGAAAAGGGSSHVRVRWDGTYWTVMGK